MKLFIPELGTNLLLTEDWTVTIHPERRNEGFYKFTNRPCEGYFCKGAEVFTYTIPKGSVLSVERIYIRAGAKDFSSVTFRYIPIKGKAGIRFWAKLDEVNNIQFEPVKIEKKTKYPNGKFSVESREHYGYDDRGIWTMLQPWFALFFTESCSDKPVLGVANGVAGRKGDDSLRIAQSHYSNYTKHYSTFANCMIACKKQRVPEDLIEYFQKEYEKFTSSK